MKIGIVTFHKANNYGAVLQAYGLQAYLRSLGHEIVFVDYTPLWMRRQNRAFLPPKCRGSRLMKGLGVLKWTVTLPLQLIQYKIRCKRKLAFQTFCDSHFDSISCEKVRSDECDLDAIIFGSDQIWNIGLTGGVDPIYWGHIGSASVWRISYAASAGPGIKNLESRDDLKTVFSLFNRISVRESSLQNLIQKQEYHATCVVDPVCLPSSAIWCDLERSPTRNTPDRFILLYSVRICKEATRFAKGLAKKKGLPIIELCRGGSQWAFSRNRVFGATPAEFLWYFHHATFVVTASFHGTVFSVLNQRQFFSFGNMNGYCERSLAFLSAVGLAKRHVASAAEIDSVTEIDYSEVDLLPAVEYSKEFLCEALEAAAASQQVSPRDA